MNLVKDMRSNYRCTKFVNVFKRFLGFDECSIFLKMMNDTGVDKRKQQHYIIKKNDKSSH